MLFLRFKNNFSKSVKKKEELFKAALWLFFALILNCTMLFLHHTPIEGETLKSVFESILVYENLQFVIVILLISATIDIMFNRNARCENNSYHPRIIITAVISSSIVLMIAYKSIELFGHNIIIGSDWSIQALFYFLMLSITLLKYYSFLTSHNIIKSNTMRYI
jgi:hypothetical protein